MEQLEFSNTVGDMQNGTATLENNSAFFPKVKYSYTREVKICIYTKTCIQMSHSNFINFRQKLAAAQVATNY